MLPQENRLKHRRDFDAVYKSGTRRTHGKLSAIALGRDRASFERKSSTETGFAPSPPSAPPTRIGISISQKVSKSAVVRNRIKRQLRAAIRELLPRLSDGWDITIVVRPGASQCNYCQFLQKLEQLLASLEVLNGD